MFPISVAAYKADNAQNRGSELGAEVESNGGTMVFTSAEAELALRVERRAEPEQRLEHAALRGRQERGHEHLLHVRARAAARLAVRVAATLYVPTRRPKPGEHTRRRERIALAH